MSHKKAKQQRKFLRTAEAKLKPILPQAFEELEGDEDRVAEWFVAASYLANLFPERPAPDFLPSKIDSVGKAWAQDFAMDLLSEDFK